MIAATLALLRVDLEREATVRWATCVVLCWLALAGLAGLYGFRLWVWHW